jgi:glycosyltransferase involved in cell wall biosynthesis
MSYHRLAINGKFLAAHPTGVHRVARELIGQLGRRREELTELFGAVPTIIAPRSAPADAIDSGFPLRRESWLTGQLWEQLELPWRARGSLLLSFCNLAPVLHPASIPMLHDAQTFSTPRSYSLAFRSFYRLVQPMIGARALRVLTVSDYSRGELVRYGVAPEERIQVIHNGVEHGCRLVPDGAILGRLGLRPGGYVLALASTQAHKNIRVLLEAFSPEGPNAGLRLVLFGGESPASFAAAGLAVPDGVVFAGRVSDAELAGLMSSALCFAMPSTTEGFGLPPLEALALGCPAVVAPCGALPEVCGPAALYAAPGAPDQWRDAFRHLAQDAELRGRLVERGREQARAMSWERAGDQLMAVLREVASARAG